MHSSLLACFAFLLLAPRASGQALGSLKIPGFTYRLDVRAAADNANRLGLDFNLGYESARRIKDPTGLHYGLKLNAKGFQTFDRDVPDINAMVGEVGLQGYYYRASNYFRMHPELATRWLELGNIEPEDQTKAQRAALIALTDSLLKARRWYATFDLHYRYETDQALTTDDHAFGLGASAEIPVLANLLDLIPSVTRQNDAQLRPLPVRAFLGLERVGGAEDTDIGDLSGDSNFWRARLEAAWATRILQGFALRMTFEGAYILDAGDALQESGRDITSFLQAWLLYPLSDKTSVMVKYISGRLPPDYDAATTGKVGLSIALQ